MARSEELWQQLLLCQKAGVGSKLDAWCAKYRTTRLSQAKQYQGLNFPISLADLFGLAYLCAEFSLSEASLGISGAQNRLTLLRTDLGTA